MSDDLKQINDKLDYISKKVTEDDPTWWDRYGNRIKYGAVGLAWLIGALTHKWGLFHMLSRLTD